MNTVVLNSAQLSGDPVDHWQHLQTASELPVSPFLSWQWFRAAGAINPASRVALVREGSELAGYFPFTLTSRRSGGPLVDLLNDGDGALVAPGTNWDVSEVARNAGLRSLSFRHTPAEQNSFVAHAEEIVPSGHVDLTAGFDSYRAGREATGSRYFSQIARKERKLERELGPVRFDYHVHDPHRLRPLAVQLAQWVRTRIHARSPHAPVPGGDLMAAALLAGQLMTDVRGPGGSAHDFASVLSALYVDETPIALHWGLRLGHRFVSAVPGYDLARSSYSPGAILGVHLMRRLAGEGVHDFEVGQGLDQNKRAIITHTRPHVRGVVYADAMTRSLSRTRRQLRPLARKLASRIPSPTRQLAG